MESLGFPIDESIAFANTENFTASFPIACFFVCFVCKLLWLELPVLCWIGMLRVGTFVLFLILEKSFQPFTVEYNINCGLVLYSFCHVEANSFYHQFVENFYSERRLYFCQMLFMHYWDDNMIFIFHSSINISQIDLHTFNHFLHPKNKFYLIMVCDLINMLLNSSC